MQIKMSLSGGKWGGLRQGAGRRRKKSKGVSHDKREQVTERNPLHVNFKFKTNIRNKLTLKLLKRAIQNSRKHGLKIIHYSFQSNHIHLLIEATNNETLSRGMRSLTITFAKGLHQGPVQNERYHLHVLKTIKEVKHAIHYVLFNEQRHLEFSRYAKITNYSSLLNIKEALIFIQKFARDKKMTIYIEKTEVWTSDIPKSYVWTRAWKELFCQASP